MLRDLNKTTSSAISSPVLHLGPAFSLTSNAVLNLLGNRFSQLCARKLLVPHRSCTLLVNYMDILYIFWYFYLSLPLFSSILFIKFLRTFKLILNFNLNSSGSGTFQWRVKGKTVFFYDLSALSCWRVPSSAAVEKLNNLSVFLQLQ